MIQMNDVHVTYRQGTDNEVHALDIPSLEIETGSWVSIIGPNGSGKSTLLKLIAGRIDSYKGKVTINNKLVTGKKERHLSHKVQFLEQSPEINIVPSMTIEENLCLYLPSPNTSLLYLHTQIAHEDRISVWRLLKTFEMGLERRLNSQAGVLSGGQKQAVALAAVLLREPRILLLDEFLAAIDAKSAPILFSCVREAASKMGITVLMVSHNLSHITDTTDRLLIMSNGKIAMDWGNKDKKLTKQQIYSTYTNVLERSGLI